VVEPAVEKRPLLPTRSHFESAWACDNAKE
jgi:hypothetical protein